jgi:hypothetical protein
LLIVEVACKEPEIGSTDPNLPTDNNCTDEILHFGLPVGIGDYKDAGDESDTRDAIPTARVRRWPSMELEWFDLGTSDVDRNQGKDGDNADADEEDDESQADDGSMQNVEDSGQSSFDLGPSDVNGYKCEHGADADADEEE